MEDQLTNRVTAEGLIRWKSNPSSWEQIHREEGNPGKGGGAELAGRQSWLFLALLPFPLAIRGELTRTCTYVNSTTDSGLIECYNKEQRWGRWLEGVWSVPKARETPRGPRCNILGGFSRTHIPHLCRKPKSEPAQGSMVWDIEEIMKWIME